MEKPIIIVQTVNEDAGKALSLIQKAYSEVIASRWYKPDEKRRTLWILADPTDCNLVLNLNLTVKVERRVFISRGHDTPDSAWSPFLEESYTIQRCHDDRIGIFQGANVVSLAPIHVATAVLKMSNHQ